MKSKALEVNLSDTRAEVFIDDKYLFFLEIFQGYVGILNRMETFLKELSHPYRNWEFIVGEVRHFSLHYFHIYKDHPQGRQALEAYAHILFQAFGASRDSSAAADNLMVLLHQTVKEVESEEFGFWPVLASAMDEILSLDDPGFQYFVQSYYQPDRLAGLILDCGHTPPVELTRVLNRFLLRYYAHALGYWLSQDDPVQWMEESMGEPALGEDLMEILAPISHPCIQTRQGELEALARDHKVDDPGLTGQLVGLVGFREFVKQVRQVPRLIQTRCPGTFGRHLKLSFLFYTIHIPGLSLIHRDSLGDINRTLTQLIGDTDFKKDLRIVDQAFSLLKEHKGRYPGTVLECIHRIGDAVYENGDIELINYFIERAVDHGFQFPMIQGTGDDWQIKGNLAHVKNIRVFLSLTGRQPKKSRRLLSALIISLAIGGVFIRDTDLFPRDLTRFFNKDLRAVYNLVKQLARLLPVFFNEIGAEGRLRDISTQVDESCRRRDRLIHFLRKQCHVESSSRIVDFMNQVILFWKTGDKAPLEPFLPPSIYHEVEETGRYVDGPRAIFAHLNAQGLEVPDDFLIHRQSHIDALVDEVAGVTALDRSRVKGLLEFQRLLNEKYGTHQAELTAYLKSFRAEHLPDPRPLIQGLEKDDLEIKIVRLLDYMIRLKEIILSERQYEVNESIYHKRHFAVDIPSMYGSYSEAKFDAMGLTLRLEGVVNVLFEELINSIDLRLITKPTFVKIFDILSLFRKALSLDGIVSNKLDTQMEFLKYSVSITTCSYTQYLDIFKGFTRAVADVVNDYFTNIHSANLVQIEARIGKDQILPKYRPASDSGDQRTGKQLDHRVADVFFRDRIATALGLQQLDVFLHRILNTLFRQSEKLSEDQLSILLNYDPKCAVAHIGARELMNQNIILLGNKGWNLTRLHHLGIPVPRGFIITTEVFQCLDLIDGYEPASVNFKQRVSAMLARLEEETGKVFGDPDNPLLLSVRSGSSISQPGMLDSFLNVGINEHIAARIADKTGNPWFAWDSYRRFLQQYGMTFGLRRDDFDAVIARRKKEVDIPFKRFFTGDQMREVALEYKQLILNAGIDIVESPMDQLFLSIQKVLASWNSTRAKDYRRIMGISDDWGTAVTVQAMVFGNRSRQSGSGVVFSHSPKHPGDAVRLWGDFTIGNQGEDVVAGLVKTLPVSEIQRELEERDTPISLETAFPAVYEQLHTLVKNLIYKRGWNPQEIEFTFQGPEAEDLSILQARDLSLRDQKRPARFDVSDEELKAAYLGQGIGVSGDVITGRVVFTLEEINNFKRLDPDTNLILLRNDTVPDDILEIDAADGILTAKGGLTSHAAVVAYNLGKTCVVGCEKLTCNEAAKMCRLNTTTLRTGDFISLDGDKGFVFKGKLTPNLI